VIALLVVAVAAGIGVREMVWGVAGGGLCGGHRSIVIKQMGKGRSVHYILE
jgi:hypothetical protein